MAVYLLDTELVDTIRKSSTEDETTSVVDNGIKITRIFSFSMKIGMAGVIGLVIAFLTSILISLKRGWSLVNSFVIASLAYLLYKLDLLGSTYITSHLLNTTSFLKNTFLEFSINTFVLLLIGLIIFFSKFLRKFIENKNNNIA